MISLPDADLGSLDQLSAYIQDITKALAATSTEREVIEIVLTPAVKALGAVAGVVLLVDHTDQQMKIAGSQGYEDGALTLWQEGPIEDHVLISDILRMKEALYFEYAGALEEAYPELESRTGVLDVVANAALPMFLDHRPFGVIVLDFREPHTFTPAERRFLTVLSGQCAVALGRAEAIRTLEVRVEERTRQLEDERTALAAFMAFTEAVGTRTDLTQLVQQAIEVLHVRFPGASIGYYEQEDRLWKARVWSDDVGPELAASISAGLPLETPMFAQVVRTRQPVFTDDWDAQREGVELSGAYGAVATYPLTVNGQLHSLLSVGLRDTCVWREADRELVRAVGRGLNLALERAQVARELTRQNAELQARTRALEAFADLTRDLALSTDPLLLIRRAQEVVMSMLADGSALYYEPQGDRWQMRVQHGSLHSPGLQAVVDAGLPYAETTTHLIPWTTGQPYYQDVYDQDADQLASLVGHVSATATLPLRVEGQLTGVLVFALFNHRRWSSVDRVVLETAVQSLELALDRAAKTRSLEEERAALEAFTRFTEAVGSETNVQTLVQQAITLLGDTGTADVVYLERDGDLFKATVWNPQFDPALLARLQAGFPLKQSSLALTLRENTAAFIDHWDAAAQWIEESGYMRAVAGYPVFQEGEMYSVLITGSRTSATWSERDKGILRAVGRSLDLALDRARQARTVTAQRDALDVRTQELTALTEELETFTYSVSHDLRTPVRHILSFMELLRKTLSVDSVPLGAKTERYLQVIGDAANQLNLLIDAMLDLSRTSRQPIQSGLVDLGKLVTAGRAEVEANAAQPQMEWNINSLPLVTGDPSLLRRVVLILLDNAVKFSRTELHPVVEIWAENREREWAVFVRDNGVGFNPRYQDKLFVVFQRLHRHEEFEGLGINLATARRIITRHGGTMFAQGEAGHGATFGFTLPK